MKLTVLLENSTTSPGLACEHGLSLHIETGEKKILFDAGQSGAFADNAEKLGIDLRAVDLAVLSHGHYDHGGGLLRFLEINKTAPVYLRREAFGQYYHGQKKYIGLNPALKDCRRLVFGENGMELAPGITLAAGGEPIVRADSFGLTCKGSRGFCPDDFRHEQYLLIEEQGRRICISGCSHRGILNIVRWFRPDVLVGGFHFMDMTDPAALEQAARALLDSPTTYYTGHCTGQQQYAFLKTQMGDRLNPMPTGTVIAL